MTEAHLPKRLKQVGLEGEETARFGLDALVDLCTELGNRLHPAPPLGFPLVL